MVDLPQNLQHLRSAISSKQDNARGEIRIEAELSSLFPSVGGFRFIKARVQDHSGCLEDGSIQMSQFTGLFDGALGAADQVLRLALDPEMLGIIRQVR